MARPVYIICAESLSLDQNTHLMSLFSIVERLQFFQTQSAAEADQKVKETPQAFHSQSLKLQVVATWMKQRGDEGQEFEHQFRMLHPSIGERELNAPTKFQFPDEKEIHRFTLSARGMPPISKSGIIEFESRVRVVNSGEWRSQSYPVVFEMVSAGNDSKSSEKK